MTYLMRQAFLRFISCEVEQSPFGCMHFRLLL